MPIPLQTPIVEHVGNGVTTVFAYPFAILDATDLKVRLGGVDVTTGFTVSSVGNRAGGTVTFSVAPGSGVRVLLRREVSLERETDYQYAGDLREEVLDSDFDRVWMALQDQLVIASRTIRAPVGEVVAELPAASARALRVLGFDSLGRPALLNRTEDGGTALALDLLDPVDPAKGAALVGYKGRTVADELADRVSVKHFGATGDGITDDTTAIQAAITYALSQYSRSANSVFGYFPTKKVKVVFPPGIYNVNSALVPNNGGYAVCDLEGLGAATIRFTGIGACVYTNPVDPGLALMSSPVHIKNLHIRKDDKAAGSVGLIVERMTNCEFENVSFYGFQYAIQVLGAIDCKFNFKGAMIQHCDFGILIQQKSGPWGIMKPNLTTIRNAYFVDCATNAIVIRRNPDESATNNGAGGVISIIDCNFQNASSGAAVTVQSPGEVPGKGIVNIIRCWFEGHGNTALSLQDGTATMNNCFIMDGLNPILLQDSTSKLVLEELHAFFSVTPTGNAIIKRADGTTSGLAQQVNSRNTSIHVDGIGGVWLGASNLVPLNNLNLDQLRVGQVFTNNGVVSLGGSGGFSDILDLSAGGTYIFAVQQSDGGTVWRGQFIAVCNGSAVTVTTLSNSNITLTGSGANARLTNTNPSAIDLYWSVLKIG